MKILCNAHVKKSESTIIKPSEFFSIFYGCHLPISKRALGFCYSVIKLLPL